MSPCLWCRRCGCKRILKSFDLVKYLLKSLKIWAKSVETFATFLKIWANSFKIQSKMAPNMLWFEKMAPKSHVIDILLFFFWGDPKYGLHAIHKKWLKIFSGKFGIIRAKIVRTAKNLPAPTPMLPALPAFNVHTRQNESYRNLKWTREDSL